MGDDEDLSIAFLTQVNCCVLRKLHCEIPRFALYISPSETSSSEEIFVAALHSTALLKPYHMDLMFLARTHVVFNPSGKSHLSQSSVSVDQIHKGVKC